jgi:signal transduction histidine kinase/CheY-like chemotaxis protein
VKKVSPAAWTAPAAGWIVDSGRRLWRALTQAHPSIVEPADRARAEFLSALIVGGMAVGFLATVWRAVIDPAYRSPAPFLASLTSVIPYVVSRTRHLRVAAWMTSLGIVLSAGILNALVEPDRTLLIGWLLTAVAVAGFFLPIVDCAIFGGLTLLLMGVSHLLMPGYWGTRELIFSICVLTVFTMLVLLFARTRTRIEIDRREAALRDVSSQHELRERFATLAEAERRRDFFFNVVGHELRNPLAAITTAIEVLTPPPPAEGASRRDPQHVAHEVLLRQAGRMRRIVDDLLDLGRLDRRALELRNEPVEVGALVASAVHAASLGERRVDVALPGEPVAAMGDPDRLEQIVVNLLVNAARYSPPETPVRVKVEVAGDQLVIRVCDEGIGLRPEQVDSIFEPFLQLPEARALGRGGLGIGLTLVRSLAEMHGGTVVARSDGPGKGSEFILTLPRRSAGGVTLAPISLVTEVSPTPPTGRRILLVDDNEDGAQLLAELIALDGHEVGVALTGGAALDVARTLRPEIVLLDISLPDMNGYEVARRLRAEVGLVSSTYVAMTGFAGDEHRRRSELEGFRHHLVKPVDASSLRSLLAAGTNPGLVLRRTVS